MQLIDATQWTRPLRKNMGSKNCELSDEDIGRVCDAFLAFEETEQSKIFPNEALGYWKVTVERPLRLTVDLSPDHRQRFQAACRDAKEEPLSTSLIGWRQCWAPDLTPISTDSWKSLWRMPQHMASS